MTFEEFKELSEEEQKAMFSAMDEKTVLFDDMEAERNSFEKENKDLLSEVSTIKDEMKKTKELNFTLARQMNSKPEKSAEDILHDMFLRKG